MRFLAIVPLYLPVSRGGAEIYLHALLSALRRTGHRVTVFVCPELRGNDRVSSSYDSVDGIDIHRLPLDELPSHLDSQVADVVIGQLSASMTAAKFADSIDSSYVEIAHDYDVRTLSVVRACKPTLVVAATSLISDMLSAHAARIVTLHPPYDPSEHRCQRGSHITLVNLSRAKGGVMLRDLCESLPEFPFLGVVGAYGNQRTAQPPANLTIQPHTADMRTDVWSRTRVLLMPSLSESYGMVSVEAAASGIPTIASSLPGIREALGDAGLYLPPGEPELWANFLKEFLSSAELEAAASARVSERAKFVESRSAAELAEVLQVLQSLPR